MSFAALLVLALAAVPTAVPTGAGAVPAGLAPLLDRGPAAEGKAAFDAGRYEEAQSKLARSPTGEAAYVRALALLELGRAGEALRALDELEEALPALADRVRFLRGQALARAGRRRDAIGAWSSVPDASLLGPEARLSRARLEAELGDRHQALLAIEPLLRLGPPADLAKPDLAASALLLAGRLRAALDDADGARAALVACWAEHPLAPEAPDCLAAARALPAPAGGPPDPEESLRRAEGLLDVNRNGSALQLLAPVAATLGDDDRSPFACRTRAALGRAHRKERQYAKAIETLRPVVVVCEDPGVRVRSLYLLASATSIAGDKDEAVGLYRRLAKDFPDHPFADDALFYAADLLARIGREPEAREALAAIAGGAARGDFRDEARFRLGWLARRAGEVEAALVRFRTIEDEANGRDGYEHARAAYWRARLLAGKGEAGGREAAAIWSELAQRYPTDYYGLLSRARLTEAGGEPAAPPSVPLPDAAPLLDPGPLADDPHFRAGVLLLRIGLLRAAADELGAVAAGRLVGPGEAPAAVLVVADLLDRAGDHRAAHALLRSRARNALRRPPSAENVRAWRIAYPPAYRDDVKRWAPPAGVPVDLLQALMREESALDPRVVSPAGAIGLTQLMLPTAQSVARSLGLGRPSRGDLSRPDLNIRIGARYLGELIRRFDGSVALALASYNAGGGAVSRWLDARRGLELDEFVEEIPVEETRGYVKRVLRSYAAYRLLYGSPSEAAITGLLHREGSKG
jgi:soluble lytic murein transglycosylase